MAIEIREYIGDSINITESAVRGPINLKEGFNEIGPISKDSIIQIIEGIHVGPTRNFTWYMNEALVSSIPSWTKPYQRPLIMHHNETDGKTIGRILSANHKTQNTRSGTPALEFTCNVPDKEGIEQIKDGRLKTVSIGVIAHDVRCSICGEQVELNEDGYPECGHLKGEVYNNEVCYWKIYKMEAKELSYVIVPSDIYAHNIKTIPASEYNKTHIKENLEKGVAIDMSEQLKDVKEGQVKSQVIDEEVKKGEGAVATEPKVEDQPKEPEVKEEPKEEPKKEEEPKVDPKDEKIKELEEKIKVLEAEKEAVSKELLNVKDELSKSVTKVEEVLGQLSDKEKEIEQEVALKESVENELAKIKVEIREAKESEFNTLRQALNKEIVAKEALSSRSDDSLMDAIMDLREEMGGVRKLKTIQEAANPALDTEKIKNNTVANVKESKSIGNMNLEEGLKDIFNDMFSPKYNY
nr:MAG TPA: serine protease [Caudoviricetes sp.]